MTESIEKKELRSKAKSLKPIMQIGKRGITPEAVEQLATFLKKRKLVKVKLLNSFVEGKDKKEIARELAEKTGSELADLTGFAVTLYRR
jgi:RNA-binding protein